MDPTMYKRYHESFMANNDGSSLLHTFLCIFYTVQCSLKICIKQRKESHWKQYVYEYIVIVLPMILVHTVGHMATGILILIDTIFLIYQLSKVLSIQQIRKDFLSKNTFKTKHVLSITCLRGLTYLITVFCILAVDFKQFPRFLSKTERFGYSLMDTGVGLFVLISGLIHREITQETYRQVIIKNIKFSSILVVLGVSRFAAVKQLDYHEHVTEYGVYWNFFFTLAVCKIFASILLFVSTKPLRTSILILILHEALLQNGLQKWVFDNTPRSSFINANREGIASSLGYVSLYVFAVYLKRELLNQSILRHHLLKKLTIGSILLLLSSYIVNYAFPTSRTLANAGYCLYLSLILIVILTIVYVLEVLSQDKESKLKFDVPLILSDINKNGLMYFLVSNIITGGINMSIQTLFIPAVPSIMILNVYMMGTLFATVYLNKRGIML